jgi:hypothetical protein
LEPEDVSFTTRTLEKHKKGILKEIESRFRTYIQTFETDVFTLLEVLPPSLLVPSYVFHKAN